MTNLVFLSVNHVQHERNMLSYDMWIPGVALQDSDSSKNDNYNNNNNNANNRHEQELNPIHFLFHIRVI